MNPPRTPTALIARVDRVLSDGFGVDITDLPLHGPLRDLEFDSIDVLDAAAMLEAHFEMTFERDDLARVNTRAELYDMVCLKVLGRRAQNLDPGLRSRVGHVLRRVLRRPGPSGRPGS